MTTETEAKEASAALRLNGAGGVERCPTCDAEVPEGFRFCGQCGRALAAVLAPSPGDVVTIVFTDLEGYTTFSSRAHEDELRGLIRAYYALVREQVAKRGGFEVKQAGDGFMIAFPSARRAVLCASDIQRAMAEHDHDHPVRRLRFRAGLNSGDAVREGDDFFGHTVNVASRIAGRAAGGQVLVSEATRVLAGRVDGVRFREIGRRKLRGLPGMHPLFEIVADGGAAE